MVFMLDLCLGVCFSSEPWVSVRAVIINAIEMGAFWHRTAQKQEIHIFSTLRSDWLQCQNPRRCHEVTGDISDFAASVLS